MKLKTPSGPSRMNASLSDDRDVLLDVPRKEPRVRTSIIGDKKLSVRDAFERRGGVEQESVSRNQTNERSVSAKHKVNFLSAAENVERAVLDDPITTRAAADLRREHGYNKVSPRRSEGGSRKSVKQEVFTTVSRKRIYRSTGIALLLVVIASIAYFAVPPLIKLLERPLKSVAVEGDFKYLPKERAMELIMAEIDGNFLHLNLERLKHVLQTDPWVESVFLSRRWPDTLVVKISEQKPIARWDDNGFLNQRGEILRVKEIDKLLGLPWLQGNEINAHEIMQQYQDLSTLLRSRGLEIISLRCDNKKSWRITLKNGVEIAIGRNQVMEKLRRFVTVYDNFLSGVWSDVKAIDVRYTNGVSIRWVPDSEMAKKYLKLDVAIKTSTVKK